jgi:RNA polymerase sigma-70 factor (ECF subfamily)
MSAHSPLISSLLPVALNAGYAFAAVRRRARPRGGADADAELLEALRAGEESAFLELVGRHQGMLLRVARSFVGSGAVAEEVVQDTWLGVLRGLDGFAGRSTFRTWLLSILVNRARSTGVQEARSVAIEDAAPAVDAARFDAGGAWAAPPQHWVEDVDDRLLAESLTEQLAAALEQLPARQREVVTLRDVDGLSSGEVCDALGLSEANQRVLLHRGRSRLRAALELELEGAR